MADALDRLAAVAATTAAARLTTAFTAANCELALVGGSVRDAFLGRPTADLDFTTNARPDRIVALVRPLAEAVWEVGRAYGTIAARVNGMTVEITTYRSDVYDGTTRQPTVEFGDSLAVDLQRRDFTVNALALRLPERELVDPTGGIEDLIAGRLRTPSGAAISFGDDPLRMLRAARFVAQLGFTCSPDTHDALVTRATDIRRISPERIRDELTKMLLAADPVPGIRVLVDTGLSDEVLPELPALRLERDEHHRHKDVYEHSLTVLTQAVDYEQSRGRIRSPDLVVRLAALLHDIGKPATRRFETGGAVTFHHHDVVGAKLARHRLRALRFDNATIDAVSHLIELHLRFFGYADATWSDAAVRRYVRDAGPELERLHILSRADVTTRNVRKADRLGFAYDDLEDRIAALAAQEELDAVRPELDGAAIMRELNLPPGPLIGEAYRYLLNLRLDLGPIGAEATRDHLRAWWNARPEASAGDTAAALPEAESGSDAAAGPIR